MAGRSAREDGRQPREEPGCWERQAGVWGLCRAPGSVAETRGTDHSARGHSRGVTGAPAHGPRAGQPRWRTAWGFLGKLSRLIKTWSGRHAPLCYSSEPKTLRPHNTLRTDVSPLPPQPEGNRLLSGERARALAPPMRGDLSVPQGNEPRSQVEAGKNLERALLRESGPWKLHALCDGRSATSWRKGHCGDSGRTSGGQGLGREGPGSPEGFQGVERLCPML